MKYILTLFCSYLFLFAQAQYSLVFCEDVDADGSPKMAATAFMVSEKGGMLRFLVRGDESLANGNIKYAVYWINSTGNEEPVTELQQPIESGWNYAWKDVVFFDPGTYRIKVYDSSDNYLTSANLNIRRQ